MHDTNGKPLKVGDNIYCSQYGFCEITTMDSDGSYMTARNCDHSATRMGSGFGHNQVAFSELKAIKVRSWKELAQLALDVQNACNLSGVVGSFTSIITEIKLRLEGEGRGGTDNINTHPVCQLFADKIASLTNTQNINTTDMFKAYDWIKKATEG